MLALWTSLAAAAPPTARTAVTVNPLTPVAARLARRLDVPAYDLNVRVHRMLDEKVGLTVQATVTSFRTLPRATHAGVRVGPRYALRDRGLADWTAGLFGVLGVTHHSSGGYALATVGVVGFGADVGKMWVYRRFAFELGIGAFVTGHIGYAAHGEPFEGLSYGAVLPIKPALTLGVGLAR